MGRFIHSTTVIINWHFKRRLLTPGRQFLVHDLRILTLIMLIPVPHSI